MFAVVNVRGPLSPFGLGQAAVTAEPIEVDRDLAETTAAAIDFIEQAAKEDRGAQLEPCWRVLRIAKWPRISLLRQRLRAFLAANVRTLEISEEEFQLVDEIISCSLELQEEGSASLKKTLEITSIVVGIAGGLALIVSRFI